jgi:hypothetical protein
MDDLLMLVRQKSNSKKRIFFIMGHLFVFSLAFPALFYFFFNK